MLDVYYNNIATSIEYSHSTGNFPSDEFHFHDQFEIYFFISGDVNYFIEKKIYSLRCGDLLLINSSEIHRPSFLSDKTYERIVIHFEPAIGNYFASPRYNLLNCFINRPKGEQNKISLDITHANRLKNMFLKIESMVNSPLEGSEILKLTYFIELLVYINRLFINTRQGDEKSNLPKKLVPLIEYIEENLNSDLSLERLEQKFYINRFYLSRLFKESTGINLHEYILYKRISMSKQLLSEGYNVTDACQLSGFNDYSNYIRIFKKVVGIPPGQYRRSAGING